MHTIGGEHIFAYKIGFNQEYTCAQREGGPKFSAFCAYVLINYSQLIPLPVLCYFAWFFVRNLVLPSSLSFLIFGLSIVLHVFVCFALVFDSILPNFYQHTMKNIYLSYDITRLMNTIH